MLSSWFHFWSQIQASVQQKRKWIGFFQPSNRIYLWRIKNFTWCYSVEQSLRAAPLSQTLLHFFHFAPRTIMEQDVQFFVKQLLGVPFKKTHPLKTKDLYNRLHTHHLFRKCFRRFIFFLDSVFIVLSLRGRVRNCWTLKVISMARSG